MSVQEADVKQDSANQPLVEDPMLVLTGLLVGLNRVSVLLHTFQNAYQGVTILKIETIIYHQKGQHIRYQTLSKKKCIFLVHF
jgi:hypothetical protein